ncbi:hypothetical protein SB847_22370, partial [Bacillus sp. SIMBA_026]
MPAMASDFARLEEKLTALMDKFNQLPLEQGLNDFSAAMSSVDSTAKKLDSVSESLAAIVEQPQMKQLPQLFQQNLI